MTKPRVVCVAGARPNFVKIAPIMAALSADRFEVTLVHTGQHYDAKLSQVFFDELEIREPDMFLKVGSGSHASQTADLLEKFEPVLTKIQPHLVLVVGDVNSTVACAMAASKFKLNQSFSWSEEKSRTRPLVAHVEAGLRSGDRAMPEEINRLITDVISDLLLTSESSGTKNLIAEGIEPKKIHFVGNVMIDSLFKAQEKIVKGAFVSSLGLTSQKYGVVTLHRPSNVDEQSAFLDLLQAIDEIAESLELVFPMHPRTQKKISELGFKPRGNWHFIPPAGYLDFVALMKDAKIVLTDSGGIQEETTMLGVRCLTLRTTTERPSTITDGTNKLVGIAPAAIKSAFAKSIKSEVSEKRPKMWDGKAAIRIAATLENLKIQQP